jgi:hypothetical protein
LQRPPLGSGWLRLEDGGGIPRNVHRLAAGGYDRLRIPVAAVRL